ncbi:hypothetical protein A2U01_0098831, partial [Trifolium medium]|nr:hypothetical protein [Trifolium medium]
CLRKVADGHFTAAVKVLGSSEVAPYNEDTQSVCQSLSALLQEVRVRCPSISLWVD